MNKKEIQMKAAVIRQIMTQDAYESAAREMCAADKEDPDEIVWIDNMPYARWRLRIQFVR